MQNVIEELQKRGFINAITSEEIKEAVNKPITVYAGFDPTGDSLHLGNLVPTMGLMWFQKYGHTPIALVGGGTGMIGDPSGKSQERNLLMPDTIKKNVLGIEKNFRNLLDFKAKGNAAQLVNNADWLSEMSYVDFLRDVGKHFRMGPMLAKESVRTRLESEEGMSYTEFSYQVMQSYDFCHLHDHKGVTIQLGGSDQWGNITAGVEYVRRVRSKPVYGATFPLLMRSDGKKFGKSEEGAIWLSPEKCSPYAFYQYFVRLPDADVISLMRILTFLPLEEIDGIADDMQSSQYTPNSAQKRLAEEVTRLIHGQDGLDLALKVTEGAAPGSATKLDASVLEAIADDMPHCTMNRQDVLCKSLVELLVATGLSSSKREARTLITGGGIYLNNEKIADENRQIGPEDIIEGRFLLLQVGKKNKKLIRF